MNKGTCCFIGSKSAIDEGVKEIIRANIEDLIIEHSVKKFIVGREGEFETVCDQILHELNKYYNLTLILVERKPLPINEILDNKLKSNYDFVMYPQESEKSYEETLISRNHWMIDNSEYLILCVKDGEKVEKDALRYIADSPIQIRNIIF